MHYLLRFVGTHTEKWRLGQTPESGSRSGVAGWLVRVAFFFSMNCDMKRDRAAEERGKRRREEKRKKEEWITVLSRPSDFLLLVLRWRREVRGREERKGLDRSCVDCGERASSGGEREERGC